MSKTKTILLVARQELFRQGVKLALAGKRRCRVVEAEALPQPDPQSPVDLVIIDGAQLAAGPVSAMRKKLQMLGSSVLVLTDSIDSDMLHRAHRLGVSGLLHWSATLKEIRAAAQAVLRGETYWPESAPYPSRSPRKQALTARQEEVLGYLQQGCLNKQIGFHMKISESTVKSHVSVILRKFDVHSRTMLIASSQRSAR